MATAPTSRKLNLTRDQLATFLTDQQQIRQFELLFATVDEIAPDVVNEISISAGTAQTTANEALAQIDALAQVVALNGQAEVLSYLAELSKQIQALESAPPFSPPTATATATTPASPVNSVQFNNAGAFGGSANFTYNSGTDTLTVGNLVSANFTSVAQGLVPASGGSSTQYLSADGTFTTPPATAPAGATTQIQFNNAGAFGASANFTFNSTTSTVNLGATTGSATYTTRVPTTAQNPIGLIVAAQNSIRTAGTSPGGALTLLSGNGRPTGAGNGGALAITSGNAGTTGNGGNINVTTGSGGTTSGDGGDLFVAGGVGQYGGDLFLDGGIGSIDGGQFVGQAGGSSATGSSGGRFVFGPGTSTGDGGSAFFQGGTGTVGGDIRFQPGIGTTEGSAIFENSRSSVVIKISGTSTTATLGFFGATPVVQPTGVAVTAAGIHAALVSLGLIT